MTEPVGLTDADRRTLGAMARHGVHAYTNSSRGGPPPTPTPDVAETRSDSSAHENAWRSRDAERCQWCGGETPDGFCPTCPAEEFLHRTGALEDG